MHPDTNFLLLTYDSCRFDTMVAAKTPVLDSYSQPRLAQTPASFTYAAHHAFFCGIFPCSEEPEPFFNRFERQLLGMIEVGETKVVKNSRYQLVSEHSLLEGLRTHGYQTVGAGAMNWFRQKTLTAGFEAFSFTGTDAARQTQFVLDNLDLERPFFAFINFGETHYPYSFKGKEEPCPEVVLARRMRWPPVESGLVGKENPAFDHQVQAVEFLDSQLPHLFSALPGNTEVVLCADHGECFGEDGYWGHGVSHPAVWNVPLCIFRLDRLPVGE